jgi:hypothetical protein
VPFKGEIVGKQEVKVCTDKVNLASVAKNSFSGKLADRIWFTESGRSSSSIV